MEMEEGDLGLGSAGALKARRPRAVAPMLPMAMLAQPAAAGVARCPWSPIQGVGADKWARVKGKR